MIHAQHEGLSFTIMLTLMEVPFVPCHCSEVSVGGLDVAASQHIMAVKHSSGMDEECQCTN